MLKNLTLVCILYIFREYLSHNLHIHLQLHFDRSIAYEEFQQHLEGKQSWSEIFQKTCQKSLLQLYLKTMQLARVDNQASW